MKNLILSGATIALVLGTAACTKNYVYCPGTGTGNTPAAGSAITLSSEVRFGQMQRLQDHQIINGETLSLFGTRTGSVTIDNQLYSDTRITANGTGGFTYSVPMYFPTDGTAIDFYAVHPYSEAATLSSPLLFAIQPDQSIETNYLKSDLLYGSKTNVAPQTGAIPLTFYHRLAKLDFVITSRSTTIDLNQLSMITVMDVLPETTLDIRTGRRTVASGTPTTLRAYGRPIVSGEIGNQTATGFTAIVVPQTVSGGRRLFGLEVGGRMMYHTPTDDVGFASGNKYSITLDVADTGITETSQITDWTDGGTVGGIAGPNR